MEQQGLLVVMRGVTGGLSYLTHLVTGMLLLLLCVLHPAHHQIQATFLYGQKIERIKDVLFPSTTVIGGREVTCSERPMTSENVVFPAETWSCYDIRVAGRRLQYWHMDGLCSTDRGPTADNDYGALCRAIMEAHHIQRPLWAAMISQASCKVSDEERVLYVHMEEAHAWRNYQRGRGYVLTLQCMADPDKKPRR